MFGSPTSRKKKGNTKFARRCDEANDYDLRRTPGCLASATLRNEVCWGRDAKVFTMESLGCSASFQKIWGLKMFEEKFDVGNDFFCIFWVAFMLILQKYSIHAHAACILHVCINMMLSRIQRIDSLKLTAKALTISLPKSKTINFQVLNMQPIGSMYGIFTYLYTFTIKINLSWRYIYHTQGG